MARIGGGKGPSLWVCQEETSWAAGSQQRGQCGGGSGRGRPLHPRTQSLFEPRNLHADHRSEALLQFPHVFSSVLLGRSPAMPQSPPYISWSLWQRGFIAAIKMCDCQGKHSSLGRLVLGGAAFWTAGFPILCQCRAGLTDASFPEGMPMWDSRDPQSTTRGTKSGDKPGPHSLGCLLTQLWAATRK